MNEITLFCPATVANLSCGFDVLGLCLEGIGDEMIIRKSPKKGFRITRITGADLPLETEKNVAGVAGMALLKTLDLEFGFEMEIHKKIKAGSGIGSSSASAAGAVVGINELLGKPFSRKELIPFAMEGEFLASGGYHADNVAPALLGGITLIKGYEPLEVLSLPVPEELFVVIIHPQIEVKTADARAVLPKELPLKTAITQWGNLSGFVHALHTNDYDLMGRCLIDVVAEPYRKALIPGFEEVQKMALEHGALGCGISGSGPSIFILFKRQNFEESFINETSKLYNKLQILTHTYTTNISTNGTYIS